MLSLPCNMTLPFDCGIHNVKEAFLFLIVWYLKPSFTFLLYDHKISVVFYSKHKLEKPILVVPPALKIKKLYDGFDLSKKKRKKICMMVCVVFANLKTKKIANPMCVCVYVCIYSPSLWMHNFLSLIYCSIQQMWRPKTLCCPFGWHI